LYSKCSGTTHPLDSSSRRRSDGSEEAFQTKSSKKGSYESR
jgi:hypothetical protein